MRIRLPFAGVFFLLLLVAAYGGLSSIQPPAILGSNDNVLHLVTFLVLTVVFYWVLDTNRRRTLNLTLLVCTVVLGIGSEFLQALLPNDRLFDLYDIVANVVGSLAGLGLCSWYHKRMLERKRELRGYGAVPGDDGEDVELGEGSGPGATVGIVGQEEGVDLVAGSSNRGGRTATLEEEVDNWDENAVDNWDEDDAGDVGEATTKSKDTTTEDGDYGA